MPTSSSFHTAPSPLRRLPSALAVPALRRRLERAATPPPRNEDALVSALEVDPIAAARALRAARPSVFGGCDALPSARQLVRALGPSVAARLFTCDAAEGTPQAELLELWTHALATARAARELATQTDLVPPEAAYLAGLVHDLPEWLRLLEGDRATAGSRPTDWVVHWQLPDAITSLLLDLNAFARTSGEGAPPDLTALVRAAELLAEFAGFRHPGRAERAFEGVMRELDPAQLQVGERLREQVEATLKPLGLDANLEPPRADVGSEVRWTAPPTAEATAADAMVLEALQCRQPQRYRDIAAALTDAAVHGGGFDRALIATWDAERATLTLRAKQDTTARRLVDARLQPSRPEAAMLQQAIEARVPAHLVAEPNGDSALLRALATDELLAIPLNCDLERPSFLLVDRAVTMAPIGDERELRATQALGMTGSLMIQNLLLRRRRQRAQKFALTDPLTRLFNRRMGIHSLEQAVARTERDRSPLTVLMCDLDHFKQLNDTYGHLQGDAALRATAEVLRTMVRKNDTVCRYGGEEFLVVLPDTTPDEATVLATRMFTAVHARGEALELPLSVSIGLTCYRFGDSVESILLRADRALYASKDYGRNRFSADVEPDDDEPIDPASDQPGDEA